MGNLQWLKSQLTRRATWSKKRLCSILWTGPRVTTKSLKVKIENTPIFKKEKLQAVQIPKQRSRNSFKYKREGSPI